MIPIPDNEAAANARYEIDRAMIDGAEWELFLGDLSVGMTGRQNFEFELAWGKLIFAWWNEENSQSWRVTGYEITRSEVKLEARRGLGQAAVLLCLRDPVRWRESQAREEFSLRERRNHYARLLVELIATKFEDAKIGAPTTAAGRGRHVRGGYTRVEVRHCGETVLFIGACEAESQAEVDGIVAAGLIWLATYNQAREKKKQARALAICLPVKRSETVIERLTFISAAGMGARIECYEVDEERQKLSRLEPVTQYELLNLHPREVSWPGNQTADNPWRERILKLAPNLIEARTAARSDRNAPNYGEIFSINGLEFARATGAGKRQVKFGVAGTREEPPNVLAESNFVELERLVEEIIKYRSSDSTDRRHLFYRLREEAWLESILRRDICALDATFDRNHVYSQIPAWRGDERSIIDLLTVNHEGRLAVIEIKASEDPELPMQGLDYWLRVEQARLRGELTRRGLFQDILIANQSPLLYLVAPRLRFHRTFTRAVQSLSAEIEVFQIGINTNWRDGVRVRTKERVNT